MRVRLRGTLVTAATLALATASPLSAVSLREYAAQHPLKLFTCTRGSVMPNDTDQTNNLKEGDKCLLLSSSGLTDLAGINQMMVNDEGVKRPLVDVRNLHLFCNHNEIAELPDELSALDNVIFLYFEHNQLHDLPRALMDMERLEGMYFTDNKFTEIPAFVFEMTRLKKLQFSHNKLTELPPEIGNLVELRHLNLADNRIEVIPASVARLTKLRVCDLSDNRITSLPEEFGQVQIVNQLRVRNNPISSLPAGFATMRATIDITGTRIDPARLSPELRAHINTEKPPGSKEPEKIIVSPPPKK